MEKEAKSSVGFKFSWSIIEDLAFLVYMCAAVAHQRGEGFDALFVRLAFVVYFATIIPHLFVRIRTNGYFWWLCLFYAFIALSCLWADPDFSTYYFTQFVQILIIVFGLSQRIRTPDDVKRYLTIYYLALTYMVILLYIETPISEWGTKEMGNLLGLHKNEVGLNAASGFIISLYFVFGSKSWFTRLVNIALAIIFAIVAIYSTSRKGLMMLPIGLVMYWWLYQKREMAQYRTLAKTLIGIIVIVIVLWIGMRFVISSNIQVANHMASTFRILVRGEMSDDSSINERQYYIKKAQELFWQNPIAGVGSNGFAAYMKEINYSHVAYSHNNFWELLSTLGLIGFLIFYYMQFKCLYYGAPWRRELQCTRSFATTLWVLLAINIVFGWWYVYYKTINNNLLFVLVYLSCYVNHSLPETRRRRVKRMTAESQS